jgi:hypothetical protein
VPHPPLFIFYRPPKLADNFKVFIINIFRRAFLWKSSTAKPKTGKKSPQNMRISTKKPVFWAVFSQILGVFEPALRRFLTGD